MVSRISNSFDAWHHPSLVSFAVTSLLLLPTSGDTFYRGKLSSGLTYRGVTYNHILVGENGDPDECFKLIATGRRASPRFVENTLSSRSREDCEEECLRATAFICRGFNYRLGSASLTYSRNCELSSQDSYGADIDDDDDFRRDPQFDFYERKSFSRQCNGLYNFRTGGGNWHGRYPSGNFYAFSNRVGPDRRRYNDFGINVRHNSGLRYNSDRYGNDYYGNNNYNPYYGGGSDCFRLFRTKTTFSPRVVDSRLRVRDLQECKQECLRRYTCRTLAFSYSSYGTSWSMEENCYLSSYEAYSLGHSQLYYDNSLDMYSLDSYNSRHCYGGSGGGGGGVGGGRPIDWDYPTYREERYETASGMQCYRDSCRLDRRGQFYFCETDINGGWDYCCAPNEYCQQYHGTQLRTCYVGMQRDGQWRPCHMNNLGRRAYLTSDALPSDTKKLADPVRKAITKKGTDMDKVHPIEVADISDLGK